MSKKKRINRKVVETLDLEQSALLSGISAPVSSDANTLESKTGRLRSFVVSHRYLFGVLTLLLFIGVGVMARSGWLPGTDAMTGKKTGWFGRELPKNAGSTWNPLAAPSPTPTPQLSKEYIYAGSRMLAVVDANANETPPADLAVWRPLTGVWYVYNLVTTGWTSYAWGSSSDIPVQGDFDGNGKTDFAIFRPSTNEWWITTETSYYTITFGSSGDVPIPADFDGDGKTDVAVYRPSTGYWYISRSSDSGTTTTAYGTTNDVPTPRDYDGDGKADISVWRLSNTTFYTLRSSDNTTQSPTMTFSGYTLTSGDQVVSADFDGDGKANYAIRNGSTWLMLNSSFANMTPVTPSGDASTDIPVANDYDGDGKVDIAVWRDSNGNWYIRKSGSSNALRQEAWGTSGDIPVPALWRR